MKNLDKANSTHSKKLNSVRKKWMRDFNNMRLLKYESKQLHHFCDKLMQEGRITLEELRQNVDSRADAKIKLKI